MSEDQVKTKIAKIEEHNRNQDIQFETFREDIKKIVCSLEKKVDKIMEKLIARPGWLVLGIISSLMSISSSLIIYIVITK